MSFGRNPHVSKAEAAEQKALGAKDSTAREHAWREAGRLWERAADRETDPKRGSSTPRMPSAPGRAPTSRNSPQRRAPPTA